MNIIVATFTVSETSSSTYVCLQATLWFMSALCLDNVYWPSKASCADVWAVWAPRTFKLHAERKQISVTFISYN